MSDDFPDFDDKAPPPPTGGSLLATVEAEVVALSEETPTDTLLQIHDRCRFYTSEIKRIQNLCEAVMMEKIHRDGPLTVKPGVRWIISNPKKTTCENVPGAIEALLSACGGDFAKFCGFLSSQPIKHGAASKTLSPETFALYFKTEYPDKLEEKGAEAQGRLTRVDEMFLPRKSS